MYLSKKATEAAKAIHIGGKSSRFQVVPNTPVLANAKDTTTNTIRLFHDLPEPENTTVKEKLKNPIDTTKSAVAGQGGHKAVFILLAKEVSLAGSRASLSFHYGSEVRASQHSLIWFRDLGAKSIGGPEGAGRFLEELFRDVC